MKVLRLAFLFVLSVALLSFFTPQTSFARVPDVYYGGFAFTGKAADIEKNFTFSHALNQSQDGEPGGLEVMFRQLIRPMATRMGGMNLKFDKAVASNSQGETLVMAIALTREDFYTEQLSDCSKLVLNLFLRVVFIDMATKTVVNSYPVNLEIIDVLKQRPDDSRKLKLLKTAYFGSEEGVHSIASILKEDLTGYRIASANTRNIQVRTVSLADSARQMLFSDSAAHDVEAYADSLAQRFSDELSRGAKVSVLPSGRDALNGKCSLIFSDGKEQDFKVPDPSYAIDLQLQDLQVKNLEANNVEKAMAFGAFLTIRVYEPEYHTEFFQKRVVHGSAKKFSVTTRDFDVKGVFREVVQLALKKSVSEMSKDSKLKKEVFEKCVIH